MKLRTSPRRCHSSPRVRSRSLHPPLIADKDPIYTAKRSNLALQGYDTVAYFTVGEPTKGSSRILDHDLSRRRIPFCQRRKPQSVPRLIRRPTRRNMAGTAPGPIAQGKTAKGDARRWAVVDGKLYLNYNKGIQRKWDKDRSGFITSADTNWPTVLQD